MPPQLELPLKAPRRLTLESGTIINRGLRDLAPKYLDSTKIAGSILRQITENRLDLLSSANVFMGFSGNDAERLSTFLPGSLSLSISAPLIGSFIERIYTSTGRTALAIVGAMDPPTADTLAPFARALASHDRHIELTLAKDLMLRAKDIDLLSSKDHRFDREAIVIEEKGGKFGQLALEEPTIRQQLKKWQNLTAGLSARDNKSEPRAPFETPSGFGAGATIISDASPGNKAQSRSLYFAATSAQLPEILSIELVAQWKYATSAWLRDLGIPPDSLKRVYVSAPYLAISAFIGQAFLPSDSNATLLMHPDQVYGWQPLLTLLAMLRQPMLPALFVHGGAGMSVHVAAVWAAS